RVSGRFSSFRCCATTRSSALWCCAARGRNGLQRARSSCWRLSRGSRLPIFNAGIADERERLNSALSRQVDAQGRNVDRLKRFFSPAVAERILRDVDGKISANTHHRAYITVVFCDLRGWTDFTIKTEPEDVMQVLEEYHREIGTLIFRYNGTLEHFAGAR